MIEPLERKRMIVFLAFAFGISWATALRIFLIPGTLEPPSEETPPS